MQRAKAECAEEPSLTAACLSSQSEVGGCRSGLSCFYFSFVFTTAGWLGEMFSSVYFGLHDDAQPSSRTRGRRQRRADDFAY